MKGVLIMKVIAIKDGFGYRSFRKGNVFNAGKHFVLDDSYNRICDVGSMYYRECFKEYKEEEIKMEFKKSDLQDGDTVFYGDGGKRIVRGSSLLDERGVARLSLDRINEDLTHKDSPTLNIVKVIRTTVETLFEREEVKEVTMDEIAKWQGVKVENLKVVK
jgi:hypothetical protein